jgi:hypothetical protein
MGALHLPLFLKGIADHLDIDLFAGGALELILTNLQINPFDSPV